MVYEVSAVLLLDLLLSSCSGVRCPLQADGGSTEQPCHGGGDRCELLQSAREHPETGVPRQYFYGSLTRTHTHTKTVNVICVWYHTMLELTRVKKG